MTGSTHHARAWTPEKDAEMRRLLADGLSARGVAIEMGVGRNAVIGRCSRAGIVLNQHRAKPYSLKPRPAPVKPPDPIPEAAPTPFNLTIMALSDRTCRWPVSGWGAETLFCGHHPKPGSPYCIFHWQRAHAPKYPATQRAEAK